MWFHWAVLCGLLLCGRGLAEIQFFHLTTAATNLSSTCVAVLNQAVNCDEAFEWAGEGRYESDETLSTVCTTACGNSLNTWLRRASGACTSRYVDQDGNGVLPAYFVERIVEHYNILCQQNSGKFCNAVMRDVFGVDAENQSVTKEFAPTMLCEDCFLKNIQTKLQMPLMSNPDLATTFKSLTSSCKKTGFPVTPIASPTTWIISTTPAKPPVLPPTPTGCQGTKYTVKSGDTCHAVASSQGISTIDLLSANDLLPYCANFPSTGTLCIPTDSKCKTRTVKQGDTCAKVADETGRTWTQIKTWNPLFGIDCKGIGDYVGYTMCISTPGGDWENPDPHPPPQPSTTISLPPFIGTDASLLPRPTNGGMINGSDIWTYNFADDTRLDCAVYSNGTDFGSNGASCAKVAAGYGITVEELQNWNPSLVKSATCTLDPKLTYCVRDAIGHASNITQYCTVEDEPKFEYSCETFLDLWSLDYETFAAYNPGVGDKCENWKLGHSYCVMARHFRQPGIISTCNKWDISNTTNPLLDPCGEFERKHGLSHARFVAWNPRLKADCEGIQYHYDYCVSIPGYRPTFSSQAPTPTRANIAAVVTPVAVAASPMRTNT